MTARRLFSRVVLAGVAVLAGAYGLSRAGVFAWPRAWDPLALPDLAAAPGWLTPWQMKLVDADLQNCALALRRAGISVQLKPDVDAGNGCARAGTFTLTQLSAARLRAEDTRCAMAARLYQWERHALQPLARQMLGQGVREILHFGSYSCRAIRGGTGLSEHATANAFDIAGFRLADGSTISVLKDWPGSGVKARFLRNVRSDLCSWFNVVLSPDYNADHANHFHVDMGWYRSCR